MRDRAEDFYGLSAQPNENRNEHPVTCVEHEVYVIFVFRGGRGVESAAVYTRVQFLKSITANILRVFKFALCKS